MASHLSSNAGQYAAEDSGRGVVLHLVTSLCVGGTERYLLRMIKSSPPGLTHEVLCKSGVAGALAEEYRQQGVTIRADRLGYLNPIAWLRLLRLMGRQRYVAVCDFTADFAGIPLSLAKLAGVKNRVACYRHSHVPYKRGIRDLYALMSRWLLKRSATAILSNSRANLDAFFPRWTSEHGQFVIVSNGVDPQEFFPDAQRREATRAALGIPADTLLIGHVGGFRTPKNHRGIVDVAARLCARRDDLRFMLVGDGELRPEIERSIAERGLPDRFMMFGERSDIPDLLRAMDLLFFPSHAEGMPNALIEAMLCGVPFVASDIPAIVETIPPECREWTAPPDAHDRLAELIERRLEHADDRLLARCRDWCISRYALERTSQQFWSTLVPDACKAIS